MLPEIGEPPVDNAAIVTYFRNRDKLFLHFCGTEIGNQGHLACSWQPLYGQFAPLRATPVGMLFPVNQFYRATQPGITTAATGIVDSYAPVQVRGPTSVVSAVGAFKNIHKGHERGRLCPRNIWRMKLVRSNSEDLISENISL